MNGKRFTLACCAIFLVSAGTALAGPCDTSQAAKMKDGGLGPPLAARRAVAISIRRPAR